MHNTINFWYRNWKKVCMKRSWQREDAKRVVQLCAMTNIPSEICFLSVNWAIPFFKIVQNYMTPFGNETKFFVSFSLLPLKILFISCVTPGNYTFYFLVFLENLSPGIVNFMTSLKRTNYWSYDTRETNLEYFLFGKSTSLLAVYWSFSLFYSWASYLKKPLKPTKFYSSF